MKTINFEISKKLKEAGFEAEKQAKKIYEVFYG